MIGSSVGVRTRSWIVLCLGLLAVGSPAALAADCPGHPDALGTSRTLVVDPREHPRIGTMQYRETLPLKDHEVVLTFDDGPLPKYSNQILRDSRRRVHQGDLLHHRRAGQGQSGRRAQAARRRPHRRHPQPEPSADMDRMPIDKAEAEIDGGIESDIGRDGRRSELAPFFRIPGLMRADGVEESADSQGIQVWSADFPADDWRHVSSDRVYELAIQRLEAKGKGILLLHDIQARTVAALPKIIRELKARGYRIVHVVPATPDRPATPTDAAGMAAASADRDRADRALAGRAELRVRADQDAAGALACGPQRADRASAAAAAQDMALANVAATLPVPDRDLFAIPEGSVEVLLSTTLSRRAAMRLAMAAETPHAAKGKAGKSRGHRTARRRRPERSTPRRLRAPPPRALPPRARRPRAPHRGVPRRIRPASPA